MAKRKSPDESDYAPTGGDASTARAATRETDVGKIPAIAVSFSVLRQAAGGFERCSIRAGGMKVDAFPILTDPDPTPTIHLVKTTWGSGRYIVAWRRADKGACGKTSPFEIDDAAFPRRPSYYEPAEEAAPSAPAPASFATPLTPGPDGRVGVSEVMQLMALQHQMASLRAEDDERRRQRDRDDEERRINRERQEHDRLMAQRDREHHQTLARTNGAWQATLAQITQARAPAEDPRLTALIERLDSEDEGGGGAAVVDPTSALLGKVVEAALPEIIKRLTASPTAPPVAEVPAISNGKA